MSKASDLRTIVVGLGCAYEVVAIASGKVPTITSFAWRARKTWWGKGLIWNAVGYLSWHLLIEEAVIAMEEAIEEALDS